MKSICLEKNCTGCGLCVAQCPRKCITLEKGLLGHLYPKINQEQCVDCGFCQKNCPSLHLVDSNEAAVAYAAWAKDGAEYRSSTSGGAASVFSRFILENNGIVYGCAMLPGINVKHIRIDSVNDLSLLKGSKYVQSSIVDVIPLIKKDVEIGKNVLFIGTPCQNAAIKKLFKGVRDNLLLVDLVCHGVPSLDMLNKHVYKTVGSTDNCKVYFRDGDGLVLSIKDNEQTIYQTPLFGKSRYRDIYYNTFIDGYTYRDSCHKCNYAQSKRVSDITISDFWGLGKKYSVTEIPSHPYGISLILPNTPKGAKFLENIKCDFNIYERPFDEAVNGNDQLRGPKEENLRIRIFKKIHKIFGIGFSYYLCEIDHILRHRLRWLIKGRILKKI